MTTNTLIFTKCVQRSVRTLLFCAALGIIFFLAFGAGSSLALAEEGPGNGTVPPLSSFTTAVSPALASHGEVVNYEITIQNTDTTYVNVVLGVTSTLPAGVAVIAETLKADLGQVGQAPGGAVIWQGEITGTGTIRISYQARVATDTCGEKTSQAVLYEIQNVGADGPSNKTREWAAMFKVEEDCSLYLPRVSRPLSPIPTLPNWNFENGLANPNWGQYDNSQASTLIYSTDKKPLSMPQGGKWFGWLGGVLNMTSELRQTVTLPPDHSGIELRFLYFIESADDCGQDNGYVLLDGVQVGSTFQLCKTNAVGAWQTAKIPVEAKYWNKQITLTLRSMTSALKNSNWLVDNVQFCSTDGRAAAADRCN